MVRTGYVESPPNKLQQRTRPKLTEHGDPQIAERAKAALRQVRGWQPGLGSVCRLNDQSDAGALG